MGVGAWPGQDQALSVLWTSVSTGTGSGPCGVCGRRGRAVTPPLLPQELPYDYYGAYGHRAHEDYTYGRLLGQEYTFSFPPHHDAVGPQLRRDRELGVALGWSRGGPGEVSGELRLSPSRLPVPPPRFWGDSVLRQNRRCSPPPSSCTETLPVARPGGGVRAGGGGPARLRRVVLGRGFTPQSRSQA